MGCASQGIWLSFGNYHLADIQSYIFIKVCVCFFLAGSFAARLVESDLRLGDFVLPSGATLFIPISVLHMDPDYWPNPSSFDPSRFERKPPHPQVPPPLPPLSSALPTVKLVQSPSNAAFE